MQSYIDALNDQMYGGDSDTTHKPIDDIKNDPSSQVPLIETDVKKNKTLDNTNNPTTLKEEEPEEEQGLVGKTLQVAGDIVTETLPAVAGDVKNFVFSPEIITTPVRGILGAVSEGIQTISEIDEAINAKTGVFTFQDYGREGFDFYDLFQIPNYISPEEYKKITKFKTDEELLESNILYNLSQRIERTKDVLPEPETGTGQAVEPISQFVTGFVTAGRLTGLGNSFKGMLAKEFITGHSFFDKDEENISEVVKDLGYSMPIVKDMFVKEEDEGNFAKRFKNGADAVFIVGGVDGLARLTKYTTNLFRYKKGTEDAHVELLRDGEVSEETSDRLKGLAEEIKSTDVSKIKGKVKKEVAKKFNKLSERALMARARGLELDKQKRQQNKQIAKENVELHNQIVSEFEENLTVNSSRRLQRDNPAFVRISSKDKDGKKVLDSDLLVRAKEMDVTPERLQEITEAGEVIEDPIFVKDLNTNENHQELFQRTLTLDNIDALTVVAKELFDASPDTWDKNVRVMDNIFNAVVRKDLTIMEDHPLWKALDKAGMSFEDFTVAHLGDASMAGRILQKYSELAKRVKPRSLKEEQKRNQTLRNQHKITQGFRRFENIRRGLLVSQIATAARNLESGLIRAPIEAVNNIVEVAMMDLFDGKFGRSNRALQANTWKDSFSGLGYILKDRKLAEEFTDIVLENKELHKYYDQMFNTINEIQINTGRGTGGGLDKVASKLEDFTQLLNTPNRWQDFMLRRATFMQEAQRLFRQEWDIDFVEELENGRIKDILRDAEDLNPTKGKRPAVEIMAEATERAMDLTYASSPESPLGKVITDFILKNNLTVILPFPRFMMKSMELMAENSMGAAFPLIRRIYSGATFGKLGAKKPLEKLSRREHRMIARNVTGVAGIMAASQMLGSDEESRGRDYKFVPIGDGKVVDVSPIFPIRQMMFLAKLSRDYMQASSEIGWYDGGLETFMNSFDAKEWIETFLGTSFRLGVGGDILDRAAGLFTTEDLSNNEYLASTGAELLAKYLQTFLVPLNQVIDSQRALGIRDAGYKEYSEDLVTVADKGAAPLVAGTEGFLKNVRKYNPLPSSEKDRPKKEDIFQEERLRIGPEYKVLAGVSIYSEDGKEGRILKSLGIDKWDMSSKSAIPTIRNFENKLIRELLPTVVELAKEREAEHKKIYAESKDILSSGGGGLDFFGYPVGISEKVYVKKAMKRDIMKMVEKMRLSDAGLAILDSTQKITYVKSMLDYRRLPSDKKEEAFQRFVITKERTPFNYSEDFLNSQVPAFRKLPEKEQKEIINELKLKDIGELGIIGKRLPD